MVIIQRGGGAIMGKTRKIYPGYSPLRIKLPGLSFESNLSDVSQFMILNKFMRYIAVFRLEL